MYTYEYIKVICVYIMLLIYLLIYDMYIYAHIIARLVDGGHQLAYHTAVATNKVIILNSHHTHI